MTALPFSGTHVSPPSLFSLLQSSFPLCSFPTHVLLIAKTHKNLNNNANSDSSLVVPAASLHYLLPGFAPLTVI